MIKEIFDDNFETEVLKSDIPVLVEFNAAWSGSCKAISPVIEEIDKEYQGLLKVAKVEADECSKCITDYKISAYPTTILVKSGKVLDRTIGLIEKKDIVGILDKNGIITSKK